MPITATNLDQAFDALETVAITNGRCPTNEEIGRGVIAAIAASGRIKVEAFGRNFRRITILTGPRAGRMTMAPPGPWRPYKTVDKDGTHRDTVVSRRAAVRTASSASRAR